MAKPLDYGDIIHGFAEGVFGRDHYACVRVVEVGPDWIRAETDEGSKVFAEGVSDLMRCQRARDKECDFNSDDWSDRDGCPFKGATKSVEESAKRTAPSLVEVTSSLKGMALAFERMASAMEEHTASLRDFAVKSQPTKAAVIASPATEMRDAVAALRDDWDDLKTPRLRHHLALWLQEVGGNLSQAHPDWQRTEVSDVLMDLVRFINSEA